MQTSFHELLNNIFWPWKSDKFHANLSIITAIIYLYCDESSKIVLFTMLLQKNLSKTTLEEFNVDRKNILPTKSGNRGKLKKWS